jgi:hypothetical protein
MSHFRCRSVPFLPVFATRSHQCKFKKCTRSLRPSQKPQASPAANSGYTPSRPISSAISRRAATSGVSPRRTVPPGKFHSIRYDERTSSNARRRRQPQARPLAAGAVVATRCGQAGNQGGTLSARQSREAWNVELAQGLTRTRNSFRWHRVSSGVTRPLGCLGHAGSLA